MLCQLVCVDRRYQRMNCFNIRELQGILKRKFFTDLVNSNDHRQLLDKSIIGLRFKANSNSGNQLSMPLFYNFGTTTAPKGKSLAFSTNYSNTLTQNPFQGSFGFKSLYIYSTVFTDFIFLLKNVFSLLFSMNISSLTTLTFTPTFLTNLLNSNLPHFTAKIEPLYNYNESAQPENVLFNSENIDRVSDLSSSMSETTTSFRFTRFNNPLVSYDYKCGNYLGI